VTLRAAAPCDAARGPATELRMAPEAVRQAVEPAGLSCAPTVELLPYRYGMAFARTAA
jgi:hypothetical protein